MAIVAWSEAEQELCPDAIQIRRAVRAIAERIAENGYHVFPNLFCRAELRAAHAQEARLELDELPRPDPRASVRQDA